MRKRNFKGRCEKRQIAKCAEVCRTYDDIQRVYAERLSESEDIAEIRCNVPLDGLSLGDYTSDFVCLKTDGELLLRQLNIAIFDGVLIQFPIRSQRGVIEI